MLERSTAWLLLLLVFLSGHQAMAETVSARLPGGMDVTAEYRPGSQALPAVLVLHGFLTTRHFNTVQSIVNELAARGYTVLAPTLSLGINARNASLPCDAIHTHTMEDDIAEIAFWVEWLVRRGHPRITLLGHSSGSTQLVAYAAGTPHPAVRGLIATSLVNMRQYTAPDLAELQIRQAERLLAQARPPLERYSLVYCKNFTATPQSYLSYMRWSREHTLAALKATRLPLTVVMGGADDRFGPQWVATLRAAGIQVQVIPGASHFFDAAHEFDLLDRILELLPQEGAAGRGE